MCRLIKYGTVFVCGIATGILGLIAGAYVLANRCEFDCEDSNYLCEDSTES